MHWTRLQFFFIKTVGRKSWFILAAAWAVHSQAKRAPNVTWVSPVFTCSHRTLQITWIYLKGLGWICRALLGRSIFTSSHHLTPSTCTSAVTAGHRWNGNQEIKRHDGDSALIGGRCPAWASNWALRMAGGGRAGGVVRYGGGPTVSTYRLDCFQGDVRPPPRNTPSQSNQSALAR